MKTYLSAAALAIVGLLLILSPLAAHATNIAVADTMVGGHVVLTDGECAIMPGAANIHTFDVYGPNGGMVNGGCFVVPARGAQWVGGRDNYGNPVRWPVSSFRILR